MCWLGMFGIAEIGLSVLLLLVLALVVGKQFKWADIGRKFECFLVPISEDNN